MTGVRWFISDRHGGSLLCDGSPSQHPEHPEMRDMRCRVHNFDTWSNLEWTIDDNSSNQDRAGTLIQGQEDQIIRIRTCHGQAGRIVVDVMHTSSQRLHSRDARDLSGTDA